MRTVFEFALERGLILSNPAKHIKRRKVVSKQIIVPSLDQFKQLVSAIRLSDGKKDNQKKSKDGADLVEFLAYSGARIGEVIGGGDANEKRPLLWSDVQFERGTIFLPGTKTEAAPRTIPMSERLREFLAQLKAQKNPQPNDRIIPIKSARKCLQTACKKLALSQFTHHDFRHFFATTCIESGVDIPTVSRWLGRFRKYGASPLIYIFRRLTVLELNACLFVSSHRFAACSKFNLASAEIFRQPIFARKSFNRRSASFRSLVLSERRNCLPPRFNRA
jgi:integrase